MPPEKPVSESGGFIETDLIAPENFNERRDFIHDLVKDHLEKLKSLALDDNDFFSINPYTFEINIDRAVDLGLSQKVAIFSQKKDFMPLGKLSDLIANFNMKSEK